MKLSTRVALAAMMFLEYAVWGAWTPVLGATMVARMNATGGDIAGVYAVLFIACIITPFIGGQLVDRYMPSQVFLGIAHLVGAGAAWMMSQQHDVGGLTLWMWVWALAFAPTLGITNSIAMHHISRGGGNEARRERDFAVIRTAGTIGWIVAAFILTGYLTLKAQKFAAGGPFVPFEEFQLTAVFALVLGVLAFLLPNTPASKESPDPWAFVKAFKLFSLVPGFTVFMAISFVACTEFQFFYLLSAPFLQDLGVPHNWLSTTKSISQVAEIVSLAIFLPISLKHLGIKRTLVIGTLAWPLRYFIFSMQHPLWLVVVSLTFHGIGFAFVFVTSQLYVDRVAPKDIRASAQSLLTLVTLGFANVAGSYFCGWLKDHYTQMVPGPGGGMIPGEVNWAMVFMVPALISLTCALGFALFFREPPAGKDLDAPAIG